MGAHRHHPATRNRLLVLVLGLASVAAACGGPDARPTAISSVAAAPTSVTASGGDPTGLFDYDPRQPLAMTTQQTRAEADAITVASITYASPKGGEVPALVVIPKGTGPFPGVIVQHGMPDTKEGLLPAAIDLAPSGAVAILIDAPFNRPQQGRVRSDPLTFTPRIATSRSGRQPGPNHAPCDR